MATDRVEGVSRIRDKICDVICKRNEDPAICKGLFVREFSARRMSRINDINELFDTLERLELGSIHNLWAFHQISAHFNRPPELQDLLVQIERLPVPDHYNCAIGRNLYALRRLRKTTASVPQYAKKELPDPDPSPSESSRRDLQLQNRVFALLSSAIGRRWRDLGRSLDYTEAEMEEFETHSSLREKIHAMLQDYSNRNHSSTLEMLRSICSALDHCRRVDLRKQVRQLMEKHR